MLRWHKIRALIWIAAFLAFATTFLSGQNGMNGQQLSEYPVRSVAAPPYGMVVWAYDNLYDPQYLILKVIDLEGREKDRQVLELPPELEAPTFAEVFVWANQVHLLFSPDPSSSRRRQLVHFRFRLPDLHLLDRASRQEVWLPNTRHPVFGYHVSPGGQKLALYGWSKTKGTEGLEVRLQVFDPDMTLSWQKRVSLTYRDGLLNFVGCRVRDDGKVYMVGKNIQDDLSVAHWPEKRRVLVFFFEESVPTPPPMVCFGGTNTTQQLRFELDGSGTLVLGGLYANRNSPVYQGVFQIKAEGETGAVKEHFIPIKGKLHDEAYTYGAGEPVFNFHKQHLRMYYFHRLHLNPDGSMLLVAEGMDKYNGDLLFKDILVIKLNAKPELAWLRRISKRQISTYVDDAYQSFAFFARGGQYFFIYNDHPDNHLGEQTDKIVPFANKVSMPMLAILDEKGSLSLQRLINQYPLVRAKYHLRPRLLTPYRELLLSCYFESRTTGEMRGIFFPLLLKRDGD